MALDVKEANYNLLVDVNSKYNLYLKQKELVELFKVSEGYTAKLLRKFEDKGYITRCEDPTNRRKKIVELTDAGIEKTDELIELIDNWELKVTSEMSDEEINLLKSLLFKVVSS